MSKDKGWYICTDQDKNNTFVRVYTDEKAVPQLSNPVLKRG